MSSSSSSRTAITVATVTLVGGIVAYAVYFDYKRRNDVSFRKKLRKDKKRVDKTVTQTKAEEEASKVIGPEELKAAMEKVKLEELPGSPDEREQYFMAQVSMGEQITAQGSSEFNLQAALCFYRALRVYPSPVELIVIYQKTVREDVFKLVMEMTQLDVKDRIEGYYEAYPPKSMNVSVESQDVPDGTGKVMRKKVLVVNKDFEAGDVIYKEHPAVSVLDFDLQTKGSHCDYCLRHIKTERITPSSDRLGAVFCSKECQTKSKSSEGLLFTLEPPIPVQMAPDMPGESREERDAAQAAFVDHIKKNGKAAPLLVARFVARQVSAETAKMIPGNIAAQVTYDAPAADSGDYTMDDHVERLRYLELKAPEDDYKLLGKVLSTALPGLEQFINDERHATLLGKMAYNAYGVCFDDGRDDKPESTERPEDVEKTRTPFGTSKQVGSALYLVSSYASHSCAPSARPSFNNGTSELHLIANRPLKKGDEITVSYVDCSQHADETTIDARRRRRMDLARGWRFACSCKRCAEEAEENPASTEGESEQKDESKVEAVVEKIEKDEAGSAQPADP